MASKKEIQQRVFKNGKLLDLDKFEWDEKTNTFSSSEDCLVLGFNGVSYCIFNTGSDCTFKTGSGCTFNTEENCVVVRKDIYEVIELKSGQKIKLKEYSIKGYDILEEEKPQGKKVKIRLSEKRKLSPPQKNNKSIKKVDKIKRIK